MIEKNPFPPIRWLWREYERAAAWYSGDPQRLRAVAPRGHGFWASAEQLRMHVPIAADIAALSAGLIFAESPVIRCGHQPTQKRIEQIFTLAGIYPMLLQAAELASVFGGVFLKWSWNAEDGFPRLTVVPADAGMPFYEGGRIQEIRLWNVLREDSGGAIWRLEERYTPDGRIHSKLYRGNAAELGSEQSLNSIPESRGIRPTATCGAKVMLAHYVPNLLPGRTKPHLPFGRSDFDGLYGLFDALDEAYSAMQRETRMTKTTVIVPAEYLRRREAIFDGDAPEWVYANASGAFTALDIDSDRSSSPITVINPAPHSESRVALCQELIRRILSLAGYAPQTAGLDQGGNMESGIALTVRERKSIRTTEAKKTLWWQAMNELLRVMLVLDRNVFQTDVEPDCELSIELPASIQPDLGQVSQIIERLDGADALSIETKVNMLHPDWSEQQRSDEVARIISQKGK